MALSTFIHNIFCKHYEEIFQKYKGQGVNYSKIYITNPIFGSDTLLQNKVTFSPKYENVYIYGTYFLQNCYSIRLLQIPNRKVLNFTPKSQNLRRNKKSKVTFLWLKYVLLQFCLKNICNRGILYILTFLYPRFFRIYYLTPKIWVF